MKTILPAPQRIITRMPRKSDPATISVHVRNNLAVCIIIPTALSSDQMRLLHGMFPDHVALPSLNKRWNAWGLLVLSSWTVPTAKPPTVDITFTASNLEHLHD